jgi:hypothetical protein
VNVAAASLADELTSTLFAARNTDGGWPYYKGKTSRLEPTCAALLALAASSTTGGAPGSMDASPLDRWQRRDGLFVDAAGEINLAFNGLAGIALASDARSSMGRNLSAALTQSRGIRIPPSTINRQDDAIQAWPWSEGTFSWVEPTAWCLLGLKRLTRVPRSPQVLRRVDDGERLLADRACRQGGWNHGNSNMLGTELPPYVPPTAIALLALHDVAGAPHVTRALQYLEANQQAEAGALALSLACVCLTVYGRPCEQARGALDTQWRRSRFLDNLHVTALALYAATAEGHRCEAFRV